MSIKKWEMGGENISMNQGMNGTRASPISNVSITGNNKEEQLINL
jgi:hypothetical protein